MSKFFLYGLVVISFAIVPLALVLFPSCKDIVIAGMEFGSELSLLIQLLFFASYSRKNKTLKLSTVIIVVSVFCLYIADMINSACMLKIIDNYKITIDFFYIGFVFFLSLFLILELKLFDRKFKEWGWFFLAAFITNIYLSYEFLFIPYDLSGVAFPFKMCGAIYSVFTALIFALILPFAFRVSSRKTFWFLNVLILLLASDFAIRYKDTFINAVTFSWAEIGWVSTFLALAWLMYFSRNKNNLLISQPIALVPFISVRSLLTLLICGVNSLFLMGILSVKLAYLKTAIDISSVLILLFLFWTIANEFSIWLSNDLTHALKGMFKSTEHLSTDGMIGFNLEKVSVKNSIFEISEIIESYNSLVLQTNKMMNVVIEANKKSAMTDIAFQVSHDIRSPLAALDVAVKALPELLEENRVLIRGSIARIKDIANNLLQKNSKILPTANFQNEEVKSAQLLSNLIDRLVSEKRMQFRSEVNIQINFRLDENSYNLFSEVDSRECLRVLSNIINNAVEALSEGGQICISLSQIENYAVILVTDNGIGIPPEILNSLGQRGKTYGKRGGSGLGLYHAKTTVESWNGIFEINSTLNVGTEVKITLPLTNAAPWFVNSLRIPENSIVVIVDDDISIHQVWNSRFNEVNIVSNNIKVLHFSMPEQLYSWIKDNKNRSAIFLIDYEFQGCNQVGLDIIENLGIESRSILVTSYFDEMKLKERCHHLGVKLIPKETVVFVPIIIEADCKVE